MSILVVCVKKSFSEMMTVVGGLFGWLVDCYDCRFNVPTWQGQS